MADSFGTHSYGSKLYYGAYAAAVPSAAPPGGFSSYAELGEVISIAGGGLTRPAVRLTHLSSDDRAHEKIPGILDSGQVTAQMNMTRASYFVLAGLVSSTVHSSNDHNRYRFLIWIPIGAGFIFAFKGFVAGLPLTIPDDDRVTIDVTLEIHGAPTVVSL